MINLGNIKNDKEMYNFIKENKIREIQILDDFDVLYCFTGFDKEDFNNNWNCDLNIYKYVKNKRTTNIAELMKYIKKHGWLSVEYEQ